MSNYLIWILLAFTIWGILTGNSPLAALEKPNIPAIDWQFQWENIAPQSPQDGSNVQPVAPVSAQPAVIPDARPVQGPRPFDPLPTGAVLYRNSIGNLLAWVPGQPEPGPGWVRLEQSVFEGQVTQNAQQLCPGTDTKGLEWCKAAVRWRDGGQ